LKWTGHVEKMKNWQIDHVPRKWRKKRGRPRMRWKEKIGFGDW